jgi:hypothetical protein
MTNAMLGFCLSLVGSMICPYAWSQQEQDSDKSAAPAAVPDQEPMQDEATPEPTAQEIAIWPPKSIMQIDVDPREKSPDKPADRSGELLSSASLSNWYNTPMAPQVAQWTAPNIYYQRLYFEDVRLERYGQRPLGCLDPWRSGALFFADMFAMPWNALQAPLFSHDYPLGLPRPGADVPAVQNHVIHRH